MKNLFTRILILVFLSTNSFAQVGPVKGKGQAQSTFQTIERLETPNSGVTVTGDKAVLLESDPDNLLVNPGFEHQTFGTGWTVNNGTATVDTTNFYDGKKSMSIALTAVNGDILTQCVTPTGQKGGTNLTQSLRVKTTLSNLQVCSVIGSSEQQCIGASNSDSWIEIAPTSVATTGSALCVKLKSTSSATGTVKVDSGYIGKNKNIGTASNAKNVVNVVWSGTQNIPHTAETTLTLSGAVFEKLENFTNSSGVFTATVDGDYRVSCGWERAAVSDASIIRHIQTVLRKNSTEIYKSGIVGGIAGNAIEARDMGATVTQTLKMSIGDNFDCRAYQSNASGNAYNAVKAVVSVDFFPNSLQQAVSPNCVGGPSCENIFSARVGSTDVVSNENVDWINGNCTDAATGRATCVFSAGLFSVAPNCAVTASESSSVNQRTCSIGNDATTSQITIDCKADATDTNMSFDILCQRVGSDRKPLNNVPILVGSVTSNSLGAEKIERAKFNCSSSSSIISQSGSWATIGNIATNTCTITASGFTGTPICVFQQNSTCNAAGNACFIWPTVDPSGSTITVRAWSDSGNAATNFDGSVICMGPR